MILTNFEAFQAKVAESKLDVLQFEFNFIKLNFNCLYITQSKVFIISNNDRRVAFSFAVNKDNSFNTKIPTDFYDAIKDYLLEMIDSFKITPLYDFFNETLLSINTSELRKVTEEEITKFISYTLHTDKAKDECADSPYFKGWHKHGEKGKKPSNPNFDKTERYFGIEVRELCHKNKITSQWSKTITPKSLDIINIAAVKEELAS